MLRITDKGFVYTPSFSTDLKKRFKKMIADQKRAAVEAATKAQEHPQSVVPMRKAGK
jgi:hypothetical protein